MRRFLLNILHFSILAPLDMMNLSQVLMGKINDVIIQVLFLVIATYLTG